MVFCSCGDGECRSRNTRCCASKYIDICTVLMYTLYTYIYICTVLIYTLYTLQEHAVLRKQVYIHMYSTDVYFIYVYVLTNSTNIVR